MNVCIFAVNKIKPVHTVHAYLNLISSEKEFSDVAVQYDHELIFRNNRTMTVSSLDYNRPNILTRQLKR